jgi:hypothetical protein
MNIILNKIVSKLTSGQWILTVAVAAILVKVCWNDSAMIKEFKELFLVVVYGYFTRDRSKPTGGETK